MNLPLPPSGDDTDPGDLLRLGELAEVVDGGEDERLRVRLNDLPGIKLSVQKQPQANTVAVVDAVTEQLGRAAPRRPHSERHPRRPGGRPVHLRAQRPAQRGDRGAERRAPWPCWWCTCSSATCGAP